MKKIKLLVAILLILAVSISAAIAIPVLATPTYNDYYVATTGSDVLSNGTAIGTPWATIQYAINNADYSNNVRVYVAAGLYDVSSTVAVNHPVSIIGPVSGGAVIRGVSDSIISVLEITANDVVIENLEFTHTALVPFAQPWVEVERSLVRIPAASNLSGVIIRNNVFQIPAQSGVMSTWNGIAVTVGSSGTIGVITITGNTVYNTRNGIVINSGNNANVSNNIIYNTKGGIMNYSNNQADANNRTVSNNSWTTVHNEWDIVWNTAYYVPNYQQSVLVLSAANNGAYVVDRRAADLAACAAITGNRSHVFVDAAGNKSVNEPTAGNLNDRFTTITLGINAVVPGGTVNVAAGIYNEDITLKDGVAVIGTGGASVTTIHGTGTGPAVTAANLGATTRLEGFTITGGAAVNGGGMYNDHASPAVNNCTFISNAADTFGGGMYNINSSPAVNNCNFTGNTAVGYGGGMYNENSSPIVTGCSFSNNTATGDGGGIYNISSSPAVNSCNFTGNTAASYGSVLGFGGAICNIDSTLTANSCNFNSNTATGEGGGMYVDNTTLTVNSCIFNNNSGADGGGICNRMSTPTLLNSTFINNHTYEDGAGGGMFSYSSPARVTNTAFSSNNAT
jgi:hypothetical protein